MKRRVIKAGGAAISGERSFNPDSEKPGRGRTKMALMLVVLVGVITAAHVLGISRYLEQENLRRWLKGYGSLAPLLFISLYSVAPALFVPGLPLTIAGGVLFGPFWGVVYSIIGATVGACLAFLISRYLARDWVGSKLKGSRWQRLDRSVEDHGWKVLLMTRLIPLFPFNLLNYAFGVTRIPFLQYAVVSFFGMLPACIAYVVFSSSLLDVIRGNISGTFVIGLILVAVMSVIPIMYRNYKKRKGRTGDILSDDE